MVSRRARARAAPAIHPSAPVLDEFTMMSFRAASVRAQRSPRETEPSAGLSRLAGHREATVDRGGRPKPPALGVSFAEQRQNTRADVRVAERAVRYGAASPSTFVALLAVRIDQFRCYISR